VPKTNSVDYIDAIIEGTDYVSYGAEGTNPDFKSIPYDVIASNESTVSNISVEYGT
jgi:hypothetical protein